MAQRNRPKISEKWNEDKLAGKEWLYNFRKRHHCLSLQTPEGCSLARTTCFNRHNVEHFFSTLRGVIGRDT